MFPPDYWEELHEEQKERGKCSDTLSSRKQCARKSHLNDTLIKICYRLAMTVTVTRRTV